MADTETETEMDDMTPTSSEESVALPEPLEAPVRAKKKHSSYSVMIRRAIKSLGSKNNGVSKRAITKHILSNNCVKKQHALEATLRNLKRMTQTGCLYKNKWGRFSLIDKRMILSRLRAIRYRRRSNTKSKYSKSKKRKTAGRSRKMKRKIKKRKNTKKQRR